jgi:hypothetical protein
MRVAKFIARFLIFIVLVGILAEVMLRTVVPASEEPVYYQDAHSYVYRFSTQGPRRGTFTWGRLGHSGGSWRVNNDGWNSLFDYLPAAQKTRPRIAIFGDSYIEGFATDVRDHVDVRLKRLLGGGVDVYSFGGSAFNLAEDEMLSRVVAARYDPDVYVVYLNGGDVSESISTFGDTSPYFYQLKPVGKSFQEVQPSAIYQASRRKRLLRQSALLRYLMYNALLPIGGRGVAVADTNLVGGGGQDTPSPEQQDLVRRAALYLVGKFSQEHAGAKVVFLADGARSRIYAGDGNPPRPFGCEAIREACARFGNCVYLDLTPVFASDYAAHHRRFDYTDNAHWNAYGNLVVARALARVLQ